MPKKFERTSGPPPPPPPPHVDWLEDNPELEAKAKAMKAHAPSMQISDAKLQAFTVGTYKKNAFQKQKEAEEAKKKREEDDAAKVYAEFVASFEEEKPVVGRFAPKTWVKGGTINPTPLSSTDHASASSKNAVEEALYKPQVKFGVKETKVPMKFESQEEPPASAKPSYSRKRQLDAFLQEIKENQDRDSRRPRTSEDLSLSRNPTTTTTNPTQRLGTMYSDDYSGSHDIGDPHTTNLYIGNLNPTLDEESVCRMFAKFGPIASVKIMWPRTQEEKGRQRNSGFVSFMTRPEAEKALEGMDGKEVEGYIMRVGWGKAVAIPPKPIFVLDLSKPVSSGLPFNAKPPIDSKSNRAVPPPGSSKSVPRPEVHVTIPEDREIMMLIHRTIERVVVHGSAFEALLMERESRNEKFAFLFKNESPEHCYYRWKLYSILNGDEKGKWPTEPFLMYDEGPLWIPPEIPFDDDLVLDELSDSSVDSNDSHAMRRKATQQASVVKGSLSKRHKLKLEAMIRKLSLSRTVIATVMVFCIDHADAADEIADLLARSLTLPNTPVFPTKLARLYLLSDVLHNSSSPVPNAWKFRSALEKHLPVVFVHLGSVWKGIQSRLRAEQMRKMVFSVVYVWEKWMIFTRDFTAGLRNTFMTALSVAEKNAAALSDGQALKKELAVQMQSKTGLYSEEDRNEDVDGAPTSRDDLDEDVDGEPMESSAPPAKTGGWISIDQQRSESEPPSKPKFSGFVSSFATANQPPGATYAPLSTTTSTPFTIPLKTESARPRTVIPLKKPIRPPTDMPKELPPQEDRVKALASLAIPLKSKAFSPAIIADQGKRQPIGEARKAAPGPPPPPPPGGPLGRRGKVADVKMKDPEALKPPPSEKDDDDMFA
ncbi:U2 snRNP-associated SURP domain-containing protein [Dinochytrium kinnereticum]|nr:U2 snRNP-associated SURP domain-containing protein [Dinochytrium kinnereticum]